MPTFSDRNKDRRTEERTVNHYHYYPVDPQLLQRLDCIEGKINKILEEVEVSKGLRGLTDKLKKSTDKVEAVVEANPVTDPPSV